jgi:hypothetical protein
MRKLHAWAIGLPLAAFFAAAPRLTAGDATDSEHVSKLLSEAKTIAFNLKEDAVEMASFSRSDVSWQTHAAAINRVRDHINELGRQEAKLKEARPEAAEWQKRAIDRIVPFLDELEGYTLAVIERINQNPKLLNTPEYVDYLEANADYATDLAAMISQYVDYGRTKNRLEELAKKLEIPKS